MSMIQSSTHPKPDSSTHRSINPCLTHRSTYSHSSIHPHITQPQIDNPIYHSTAHLSVNQQIYPPIFNSSANQSTDLSMHPSITHLSIHPHIFPSIYNSSTHLSILSPTYPFIHPSARPYAHPSIHSSRHWSIHSSVSPPIQPCIHRSIHHCNPHPPIYSSIQLPPPRFNHPSIYKFPSSLSHLLLQSVIHLVIHMYQSTHYPLISVIHKSKHSPSSLSFNHSVHLSVNL